MKMFQTIGVPAFLVNAILATSAWAQLPPTLTGEFFVAGPVQITSASCNPDGTSTFTYSASGEAYYPYPGTFTETGTVSIGAQTGPWSATWFLFGPVATIEAFFTIDSPVGHVTGTKHRSSRATRQEEANSEVR